MRYASTILPLLIAAAAHAAEPPSQVATPTPTPPAPAAPAPVIRPSQVSVDPRAVTLDRLQRRVTVDLKDVRLDEVIRFIADITGADIDPLWADQGGVTGLDREKTISLSVKEVRALTLLELILNRATNDADAGAWQMSETGAIEIGPRSRLNKSTTLKIYDVQDMLFEVPSFNNIPQLDLEQVLNQSSSGGGGGGGNVISSYEPSTRGLSEAQLAEKLVTIITTTIEPDQWRQNGGDAATITFHNGVLLVRAPDYIHRQLAGYPYWGNRAMSEVQAREYRAAINERETRQRETVAAPQPKR